MSGRFEATVDVDRPVDGVSAFLADGRNDLALAAARKDVLAFGQRIKTAIEAS